VNSKLRGDRGEDRAADYLQSCGHHIVKRNLRCRSGEVDIVVYRDDTLVFVEVKHWRTLSIFDLERSITKAKRSRILGCAREFLTREPQWRPFRLRFDIIHVGSEEITHYPSAFTESGFQ
jgi:putative endonuclease